MSRLRKIKRRRGLADKKPKTKISLYDFILMIGISMILVGGIIAFFQYCYFSGGVPEGVSNSRFGTEYTPAQPAGDPGRKTIAVMGISCFGIGVLLTSITLLCKTIAKKFQRSDDNYSHPGFS